jgi:hypothetical protein
VHERVCEHAHECWGRKKGGGMLGGLLPGRFQSGGCASRVCVQAPSHTLHTFVNHR